LGRHSGRPSTALKRFRLLPEAPAPMRDTQFRYVPSVEGNVGMAAHRRYQWAMGDRDVFEDATIFQDHRDDVQVVRSLGLIEKILS